MDNVQIDSLSTVYKSVCLLLLLAYVVGAFVVIGIVGSSLGSRSVGYWLYLSIFTIAAEALVVQTFFIWLCHVLTASLVYTDANDLLDIIRHRCKSIMKRSRGMLHAALRATSHHLNPACRAARAYPHLPIARMLFSLSDFDLPLERIQDCRRSGLWNRWRRGLLQVLELTPLSVFQVLPQQSHGLIAELFATLVAYLIAWELCVAGLFAVVAFIVLVILSVTFTAIYELVFKQNEKPSIVGDNSDSLEVTNALMHKVKRRLRRKKQLFRALRTDIEPDQRTDADALAYDGVSGYNSRNKSIAQLEAEKMLSLKQKPQWLVRSYTDFRSDSVAVGHHSTSASEVGESRFAPDLSQTMQPNTSSPKSLIGTNDFYAASSDDEIGTVASGLRQLSVGSIGTWAGFSSVRSVHHMGGGARSPMWDAHEELLDFSARGSFLHAINEDAINENVPFVVKTFSDQDPPMNSDKILGYFSKSHRDKNPNLLIGGLAVRLQRKMKKMQFHQLHPGNKGRRLEAEHAEREASSTSAGAKKVVSETTRQMSTTALKYVYLASKRAAKKLRKMKQSVQLGINGPGMGRIRGIEATEPLKLTVVLPDNEMKQAPYWPVARLPPISKSSALSHGNGNSSDSSIASSLPVLMSDSGLPPLPNRPTARFASAARSRSPAEIRRNRRLVRARSGPGGSTGIRIVSPSQPNLSDSSQHTDNSVQVTMTASEAVAVSAAAVMRTRGSSRGRSRPSSGNGPGMNGVAGLNQHREQRMIVGQQEVELDFDLDQSASGANNITHSMMWD